MVDYYWPSMETGIVADGCLPAIDTAMLLAGLQVRQSWWCDGDSHGGVWSLTSNGYGNGINGCLPTMETVMVVGGCWPARDTAMELIVAGQQ